MQFVSARVFMGGIGGLSLTLCAPSLLTAQVKAAGAKLPTAVSVPFVGCESDGQVGPLDAPASKHQNVSVTSRAAQRLAFYQAETGFGVLAPRGWYCFGVYGSGGDAIYVSPRPLSSSEFFSPNWKGLMGPAVRFGRSYGETSGRFNVAEIIARVFPAHKAFVAGVAALFDEPGSEYPSGPYPTDRLNYRSDEIVEYQTPPNAEGLGTRFPLKTGALPTSGVAILIEEDPRFGENPDVLLLSVRLPPDLVALAPIIVRQAEREARRNSGN